MNNEPTTQSEIPNEWVDGAVSVVSELGLPVFPCRRLSIEPAWPDWRCSATTDTDRINDEWGKFAYNTGVPCGRLVVVELRNLTEWGGGDGYSLLLEWEKANSIHPADSIRNTLCTSALFEDDERKDSYTDCIQFWFLDESDYCVKSFDNKNAGVSVHGSDDYVMAPPASLFKSGPLEAVKLEWCFFSGVMGIFDTLGEPVREELKPLDDAAASFINHVKAMEGTIIRDNMPAIAAAVIEEQDGFSLPSSSSEIEAGMLSVLANYDNELMQTPDDLTMGKLFAKAIRGRVAWVADKKCWFAFNGSCWESSGAEQICEQYAKDFVRCLLRYVSGISNDKTRQDMAKTACQYQSLAKRKTIIEDAKSELVILSDEFDKNKNLLNINNGTLDLSGDLVIFRPHAPEDMLTKCAPVEYDPSADCREYENTLARALEGDAELVDYFKRLCGIIISGNVEHECIHFIGEAVRTGKGCAMQPLVEMLGSGEQGYARTVDAVTFSVDKFANGSKAKDDIARLDGARLALSTEAPEGMELDATILKRFSGGDNINARRLYQSGFEFKPCCQIVFVCNSFPHVRDASLFDSGRVRCIPFNHTVPEAERDKGLKERLCQPRALSGLLNFCLEGLAESRSNGFEAVDAVEEYSQEYRRRSDVMARWVKSRLAPSEGGVIQGRVAFEDFKQFMKSSDIGKQEFLRRIRTHVRFEDRYHGNRNVIVGYALREQ